MITILCDMARVWHADQRYPVCGRLASNLG
jgi:hypothetical protein